MRSHLDKLLPVMHCRVKHRISHGFGCSLEIYQNEAKKLIFWLILAGFWFTPFYALWFTPQSFIKLKVLWRYIISVRFMNMAFAAVKLQIFKTFRTDSASMKWFFLVAFWALTPPNIVRFWWIFHQRYLSRRKKKGIFKNLRKIQIFTETGDTQSLLFWSGVDTLLLPEEGKNKKNNCFVIKALTIGLSKYRKIKVLSPLAFPGKIRLLFPYSGYFW